MIDNRTDAEINRVIAEWCGWRLIPSHDIYISGQTQAVPEEWESPNGDYHDELPNYCGDLNACHEAESKLPVEYQMKAAVYVYNNHRPKGAKASWTMYHAAARQRAEALVRTIEESKPTNQ